MTGTQQFIVAMSSLFVVFLLLLLVIAAWRSSYADEPEAGRALACGNPEEHQPHVWTAGRCPGVQP